MALQNEEVVTYNNFSGVSEINLKIGNKVLLDFRPMTEVGSVGRITDDGIGTEMQVNADTNEETTLNMCSAEMLTTPTIDGAGNIISQPSYQALIRTIDVNGNAITPSRTKFKFFASDYYSGTGVSKTIIVNAVYPQTVGLQVIVHQQELI